MENLKQLAEVDGISILGKDTSQFKSMKPFLEAGYFVDDVVMNGGKSYLAKTDNNIIPSLIPRNFGHGSLLFKVPLKFSIDELKKISSELINYLLNNGQEHTDNNMNESASIRKTLEGYNFFEFCNTFDTHFRSMVKVFHFDLKFYRTKDDQESTWVEFRFSPDFKIHELMTQVSNIAEVTALKMKTRNPKIPFLYTGTGMEKVTHDYIKFCKSVWELNASYTYSQFMYILDKKFDISEIFEPVTFKYSWLNFRKTSARYWEDTFVPSPEGQVFLEDSKTKGKILGYLKSYTEQLPMTVEFDTVKKELTEAELLQPIWSIVL